VDRTQKKPTRFERFTMKKWVVLVLLAVLISGCSWQKVKKWFEEADWERSDRTIHMVDTILR